MIVAKLLFKLLGVMNSETSPGSLAAAFALGIFLGLVPLLTLQAFLVLAIVLFLRVNISLALAATLFAKFVSSGLAPQFHELGRSLLEREGLAGLWRTLSNHPALAYASLNHTITLGRTVVALAAVVPAWGLGFALVRLWRDRLEPWWMRTRLAAFLKSLRVYSLYKSVTSPFG